MIRRGSSRLGCVVSVRSFWWFSEPFPGDFLGAILRPFTWGFGGGYMLEPFVVLFPFDSPPKYVSKGARFWGFRCARFRYVLGGISLIPLGIESFSGPNLGYGVPMRCSCYPQSPAQIRGAIWEIRSWIWGSWPAGVVHPELPMRDRSNWCSWPVWPMLALCGICLGELLCSCCVFPLSYCLVHGLFGVVLLGFVRGFPSGQVAFGGGFCSRA
jgi:hypothetical protein